MPDRHFWGHKIKAFFDFVSECRPIYDLHHLMVVVDNSRPLTVAKHRVLRVHCVQFGSIVIISHILNFNIVSKLPKNKKQSIDLLMIGMAGNLKTFFRFSRIF